MAAVLLLALFVLTLPVARVPKVGAVLYLAHKVLERLSTGRWFDDLNVGSRWTTLGIVALAFAGASAALCSHHTLSRLAPVSLMAAIRCAESALVSLRRYSKPGLQ